MTDIRSEHEAALRTIGCGPRKHKFIPDNSYKCRYSGSEAGASWRSCLCPDHQAMQDALVLKDEQRRTARKRKAIKRKEPMTPIHIIREKYVGNPDVVNVEQMAVRLGHHGISVTITNAILSDCGDRWMVKAHHVKHEEPTWLTATGPSLRTALLHLLSQIQDELPKT